jgi:magnesium transporter
MFDALSDNIHQLLNIYFSASSQRTNETMRILTIFSVFFMPLTFIVGIYGMNFEFMPELGWKMGYPGVMGLMAVVTLLIYIWFKRKRWL